MGSRIPGADYDYVPGRTHTTEGPKGERLTYDKARPAYEAELMLEEYAKNPTNLNRMRDRQMDAFDARQARAAEPLPVPENDSMSISAHLEAVEAYQKQPTE